MKTKEGIIKKISGKNTINITLKNKKYNKKLKEKYSKKKNILVNFESTILKIGMKVIIFFDKKLSKKKSWQILKIIKNDNTRK